MEKVKELQASPELNERLRERRTAREEKSSFLQTGSISPRRWPGWNLILRQFEGIFLAKKEHIGRKIDFLIQEIGREINTIGSQIA